MEQIQKTYSNRKPLHIVPQILKLQDETAVTIQDPVYLNGLIDKFKQKIQDLIAQIYQLTIEKDRDQNQQYIVMSKMKQDYRTYQSQIEKCKKDITQLQDQWKNQVQKFQQERERQRKNMQNQKSNEIIELQKIQKQLNDKYLSQKKYQELQQSYRNTIKTLVQNYNIAQYRHHDAMNYQQNKQIKQSQNVKSRNQLNTKDVLKTAQFQAHKNVINEQKLASQRNRVLKEKLLNYTKQLQKLKKQRQIITKRNKQFKLNASINSQGLQQYKAVGALQMAKIKAFKQKVDYMKNFIADELANKNKIIKQIKQKGDYKLNELKEELQKINARKQAKNKQLNNIKCLAQTILLQRSQVEQFFLTAMQNISHEIKQSRSKNEQSNVGTVNQPSKIYNQKIDISELDLVDKQKILRTLFTRMSIGSKKQLS